MSNLRAQKQERYDQVAFRLCRWWKQVKMCADRKVTDEELIRAVANAAGVSRSMASKVLYRERRSKRVLAYLSAGIQRIQQKEHIPTWLCGKPDLSDVQPGV